MNSLPPDDGTILVTVPIPRAALTLTPPPPDTLSQKNILAATGIPPRTYLELLRAPDFDLPITTLGKLRLVDRARFIAWISSRAKRPTSRQKSPDAADALAAELGLERRK
jgi:hypothetical protein